MWHYYRCSAPNLQEHAKAIITMDSTLISASAALTDTEKSRFHPFLVNLIAASLKIPTDTIMDLELQLIDIQPSTLGGAGSSEFVLSGRLDNLSSAFQALRSLVDSKTQINSQSNICIALLFDHEEIGSASAVGAGQYYKNLIEFVIINSNSRNTVVYLFSCSSIFYRCKCDYSV